MSMEGVMGGELIARSNGENAERSVNNENDELLETLRTKVIFPHVESAVNLYAKEYPEDSGKIEIVRDILGTYFEHAFKNVEIFASKELDASFPYTSVSLDELASVMYAKYRGGAYPVTQPEATEAYIPEPDEGGVREFNFCSVLTTLNGNPFTFSEESIRKLLKYLSSALNDISRGKKPLDYRTYTIGFPTNIMGHMSPEFWEKMKEDTFGHVGELYAQFVEEEIQREEQSGTDIEHVRLAGVSMGSGLAVKTAEHLLHSGVTVQDHEKSDTENKPYMSVRADVPVVLQNTKTKKFQIPAGFVADSLFSLASDTYLRETALQETPYITKVNSLLTSVRGIPPHDNKEQLKLKNKGVRRLIMALGEDITVDPNLKMTKIINRKDLTMMNPEFNRKVKEQERTHGGSLGEHLIADESNPNVRSFAVDALHLRPAYTKRDLSRVNTAASFLKDLKKVVR